MIITLADNNHPHQALGSVIFVNENENEMAKNEKETYLLTKAETDRKNIENVNVRKRKQTQDENVIVSVP